MNHPRARLTPTIGLAGAAALAIALLGPAPGAAPAASREAGIDVSRFNQEIAWPQVATSPVEFAFVQASRGSGEDCTVRPRRCGADGFYDYNYAEANAAGIRVGAYHRAFTNGNGRRQVRADARAEASVFVAEVGELREGDLLPALDFEAPFDGLSPRELRIWVGAWLDLVEEELGARPIIYTNLSSWSQTANTTRFADAGHPLWVANWNVEVPLVPAANWGGQGWSVWQYTSSGAVPGIEGRVDRNWLRGGWAGLSVD